ncbi:MAG: uracil-DNA glycosylase, partial [Fimbriimonas ginsengisoli]|nr:uracil-DNA glycosylase [Fimbriimonas ginsengisoli]
ELSETRTQTVFGVGNPQARILFIGEAPGADEDAQGEPFVGRAGQLLDRALDDAGVGRARVYITNTVKCRAADWASGKPVNRAPTDDEAAACRRWLEPQLGLLAPKVILCVGAPSARNLIKKSFRITQERGLYFPCAYARTAIATLHPSYVLRQQTAAGDDGGYGLMVADIRKAWEAARRLVEKELDRASLFDV